jgi:Chaperone of endosialidase
MLKTPTVGDIVVAGSLITPGGQQGIPGEKGDIGDTGPQGIIEEAPIDGLCYGRKDAAWNRAVATSGDVMTGGLEVGGSLLVRGDVQVDGIFPSTIKFKANGGKLVWGTNESFHYYVGDSLKFYWNQPGNELRSESSIYAYDHLRCGLDLTVGRNMAIQGTIWSHAIDTQGSAITCPTLKFRSDVWGLYWDTATGNLTYYDATWKWWWQTQVSGNNFLFNMGIYGYSTIQASGMITGHAGVTAGSQGLTTSIGGANRFGFHWNGSYVYVMVDNATGWLQVTGQSDERLKEDIAPSTFDCLGTVLRLPIDQFRWKPKIIAEPSHVIDPPTPSDVRRDGRTPLIPVGFVAQRVHQVFPEGVIQGDEGIYNPTNKFIWNMEANTMLAVLTGAIQQLEARVKALEI